MLGHLEAAADALHHLLYLISSGESAAAAAAASPLAGEPANQLSQPHGSPPISPPGTSSKSPAMPQKSEDSPHPHDTADGLLPSTQPGGGTELHRQTNPGETTILANSSNVGSQPASQHQMGSEPMPQHRLQYQPPTPVPSPSHPPGQPPSDLTTNDQQVPHQLTHSQQVLSQQVRNQLPDQDPSQQGYGPVQPKQGADGQGSLPQEPQPSRVTSRHLELPYYKLKLIREACHTVMTLAEKRGQPALMLPILESMQQVRRYSHCAERRYFAGTRDLTRLLIIHPSHPLALASVRGRGQGISLPSLPTLPMCGASILACDTAA